VRTGEVKQVGILTNEIRKMAVEIVPNDPFGRTYEEAVADKVIEMAASGDKAAAQLIRGHRTLIGSAAHRALDKKLHALTRARTEKEGR
jgi:hypothetical protein